MFTGLVSEVGTVREPAGEGRLAISASAGLLEAVEAGDSISVAGVCLTASQLDDEGFEADVMLATLARTRLGALAAGAPVNLEPALRVGAALGGHLVQGHVDGIGEVRAVEADGNASRLRVEMAPALRRYVVGRGSIAVDGVSLTVAEPTEDGFEVSLIPETRTRTTLGALVGGDRVNLEVDVVARYVERLMQGFEGSE